MLPGLHLLETDSLHFPTMIETDFFILTAEQYQEVSQGAAIEGVSVDYFLFEFCDVQGEWTTVKN